MDYEKEYKKLKASISNAYLYAQTDSAKAVLESILAEPKESEDERIRKEITELVMQPTWQTEKEFFRRQELVVWLEKIKKLASDRWDNYMDATKRLADLYDENEQLKEKLAQKPQRMVSAEAKEALYGKPALSEFENTLADICRGWIGEEIGWEQYIIDNADVLLRIAFKKWNDEKQDEQKPADEVKTVSYSHITSNPEFFQWIYDRLKNVYNENPNMDYMRSLRERIKDMRESAWSEEDEARLQSCLNVLQPITVFGNIETKNTKWLKSLKQRMGG
jgi:hypothetical protein